MKDYHINIIGDSITATKDINRRGVAYMKEVIWNCWKKRYILEVGDFETSVLSSYRLMVCV